MPPQRPHLLSMIVVAPRHVMIAFECCNWLVFDTFLFAVTVYIVSTLNLKTLTFIIAHSFILRQNESVTNITDAPVL